ncbi:DUF2924 domain-containing protein [Oceanicaulis sp. UBA2681]|uniref:DUF2924 domain-containing protein n=1 Tax=Oceanicaulis sp. UBA2681 TaxID=1947007 RepID=UPI000EC551B3|nr:DUF2924 domain-containing protein [Oceanicaulis sp. UBA2681]HCR65338.1 DUF2924 domain-containing protein [Oceanicaulis sp.]|tara:strand:+ start:2245 stop:2658 length:414 start_codon:yes stop_codon:yes gene_type:complete
MKRLVTIKSLEDMAHSELTKVWRELHEEEPPRRMSAVLLRRILAHEAQVLLHGALPRRDVHRLKKLTRDTCRPAAPGLAAGGRLIREWNGETHTVEVLEKGFVWRGRTYRSLSAIAEAITGVRWSGPRFFGLKSTKQ